MASRMAAEGYVSRRATEVQAATIWKEPGGTLGILVREARERAARLGERRAELEAAAARAPSRPSLAAALAVGDLALVAEIKRRSPSKGTLNAALSLTERAVAYAGAGAAALSILTQGSHFGGSLDDLAEAATAVTVPLLRKDFLVGPLQLLEARAAGASAVLLIARALSPEELPALAGAARDAGLETLVEVRDEWELERAVACDATVIGVNNRNLETLEIDPVVSERLLPMVPGDRPAVYESGVRDRADVEHAAACGADAVLVGSTLSVAADPAAAVRELTGVARRGRGTDR